MNLRKDHYRVFVCLFVCSFVEYNNNNNKDRYHWFGKFCRCRERGNSRATSAYIYSVEESRGVPVPLFPSGTSSSVVSMPRLLGWIERRERQHRRCLDSCVLSGDGLKNWPCLVSLSPRVLCFFLRRLLLTTVDLTWSAATPTHMSVTDESIITLSGGSLGSCVDEERSQLREVM